MGDLFSSRIIRTGVPQGSVPSPTLFKFYVHDAVNYPPEFKLQSYAKYFHPFVQSRDRIITCPCYFSIYLKELTFFTSRLLDFSSPKSSARRITKSSALTLKLQCAQHYCQSKKIPKLLVSFSILQSILPTGANAQRAKQYRSCRRCLD